MTHPEGESEDGDSWNQIVEGIFHPVISQVPNRWDDHNSVATPSRTTTESLLEVRSLEDGVSSMFKPAMFHEDLNIFFAQDVL
ncbi:hypothetical protein CABS02_08198 [Colletotrichum abscissum]|uniref:Uncharacterized protein n=1 Tax=Colletotrichum abscissum TaxID=1671311 RepID=A0A9P9XD75_9PEZI|nr:hypothetical protein CABS02_08198 [Colletotrichum abscissum]